MRTSQHTGVSTFASRTSPSTDQSLQKSLHLSHADKIELKKISFPSENKKYATAQPSTTKTEKRSIVNGLQGLWSEGQLITAPTKNWRFSASYDSFVVNQTFVLRMNICGKNRQLLVAAKRWASCLNKIPTMTFNYSDAWLLQAIRLSEQNDIGATLTEIISVADYTNRAIMTYEEFSTGTSKLKRIGLVTERANRLLTTDKLKEWWTRKFEGKRKIGIHKGMDEILKYLNKTYGGIDEEPTKTKITELDLDKAIKEYHKSFSKTISLTTTNKKEKR